MKDAEIIEMAKQVLLISENNSPFWADHGKLIAFARLIEAATREEDARICEDTEGVGAYYECAAAIRNSGGE